MLRDRIAFVADLSKRIRRIVRAYAISIAFWLVLAVLLAWQEHANPQAGQVHVSYATALTVWTVICFSVAVLTPGIFYLVRRYPVTSEDRVRRSIAYLCGIVPFVVLYACVRWSLLPSWSDVTQNWEPRTWHSLIELVTGGFAAQIWVYIGIVFAAHAYHYFERSRHQEMQKLELQQALATSELQALKSQIHPHFLFNTLHNISSLIDSDGPAAKAMIIKLSSLLRAALRHGNSDLITLEEEIGFIAAYLDIEKLRLGSRLSVRWCIAQNTRQLLVPQLILQPLVENAIVHGISCCREGGWIEIAAQTCGPLLQMEIRNSVGGKSTGGMGLGIKNTAARLKYLYLDEAAFSFALPVQHIAAAKLEMPAFGSHPEDDRSKPEAAVSGR